MYALIKFAGEGFRKHPPTPSFSVKFGTLWLWEVLRAVRLVHENGLIKRMWQINICHLLLTCLGVHIHTLMLLQLSYVRSQQGSSISYMGPLQSNLILMVFLLSESFFILISFGHLVMLMQHGFSKFVCYDYVILYLVLLLAFLSFFP